VGVGVRRVAGAEGGRGRGRHRLEGKKGGKETKEVSFQNQVRERNRRVGRSLDFGGYIDFLPGCENALLVGWSFQTDTTSFGM